MDNSNNHSNNRDMYLKQMNKNSLKISKQQPLRKHGHLPPPPPPPPTTTMMQPQSQQPPVYNIDKNDFRDVVQRLTGSPAHDNRFPIPPPPPPPSAVATNTRPPSSRLQRIRPPPLAQITNRSPQFAPVNAGQTFPPLPPFPSVHTAAESPISSYLRFLGTSVPSPPPWNGGAPAVPRPDFLQNDVGQRPPPPPPPPVESPVSAYIRNLQNSAVRSSSPMWNGGAPPQPTFPLSPLPFGCIPSPRSNFGMLSPSFLLSPTGGQFGMPQLPLSPTMPVSSPRWKKGI